MANPENIKVEVVYALIDSAVVLPVTLRAEATVQEAIEKSDIVTRVPAIDLQSSKVGIYGKVCKMDHKLRDGDRIEIYRPLIADPKMVKKKKSAEESA